jgi:mannose/cellobiose epimerase-like protein (N-acyl-D-glucosamine 2-epimerase family)
VVSGGFHATLDRSGNPTAPEDKGLVQQARHLWMLSTWHERRDPSPVIQALADEQYDFLAQHFLDAADGAFVLKVSRDCRRVVDGRKQLYAESFALYALSTSPSGPHDPPELLMLPVLAVVSTSSGSTHASTGSHAGVNFTSVVLRL